MTARKPAEQILAASTFTLGRPSLFPLDLAAAMPDLTRSRINSLSNSAMLAKMPNMSRPLGVLVSAELEIEANTPLRELLPKCATQKSMTIWATFYDPAEGASK
jgi:hypothetical protein